MIKVTVGERKTQRNEFPKIMKSTDSDYIVLFTCNRKGTVLRCGGILKVGELHDNFNTELFADYNLPITLQNDTNE